MSSDLCDGGREKTAEEGGGERRKGKEGKKEGGREGGRERGNEAPNLLFLQPRLSLIGKSEVV